MKQLQFIFLLLLFNSQSVSGQTYNMATTTISTCTGTFRDPGGVGNYPHNQNLTMTIQPSAAGSFIQLAFSSFNTQVNYDYLAIYDGSSVSAPLIGHFSGTASPGTISASSANTSGALTLVFFSNGWGNSSGWNATISCNATGGTPVFSQTNGTFTTCNGRVYDSGGSTHEYTWYEDSEMTLCPSTPGQCLRLQLDAVTLETYADSLMFFDGPSTSSPLLSGFGNTNIAYTYPAQTIETTTANTTGCLTISFYSDLWTEEPGWSGTLSCVSCTSLPVISMYNGTLGACSGSFFDTGGNVNGYMNENTSYTQTICSNDPAEPFVNVTFNSLNLENGFDILTVYNGSSTASPVLGTYTGVQGPFFINGSNPSGCLTFQLTTDLGTNASGWAATIDCSEFIALSSKLVTFTGEAFEGYNQLQWFREKSDTKTHYLIQRSSDGGAFTNADTVECPENQQSIYWYDWQPYANVTYYRLFEINANGEHVLLGEIALQNNLNSELFFIQNPFDEQIVIHTFKNNDELLSAKLINSEGKLIPSDFIRISSKQFTIPTSELAEGTYYLTLTTEQSTTNFKLIKLNSR